MHKKSGKKKSDIKIKPSSSSSNNANDNKNDNGTNLWTKIEMNDTDSEKKQHDVIERAKIQMEYMKRLFQRENFYVEIIWFMLLFGGIIITLNTIINLFSS